MSDDVRFVDREIGRDIGTMESEAAKLLTCIEAKFADYTRTWETESDGLDGLDCELVYALVPRRPLTDVVQERARAIAMEEVAGVAHTMSLEEQRPGAEQLRKQVERRTDELLRGRWSNLWR